MVSQGISISCIELPLKIGLLTNYERLAPCPRENRHLGKYVDTIPIFRPIVIPAYPLLTIYLYSLQKNLSRKTSAKSHVNP